MLRLTLRNVLGHKVRFALTTLAVVMGVGFVVGSLVVTDSLRGSVNQLFEEITAGTDVSVRAESNLDGGGMMSTRGRIPADLTDLIESVDGVAAAERSVAGYAQLLDLEGDPLTTTGAPFIGISWGHVDQLRPVTLDRGRAPDGVGEIAIDRGTAEDYGFEVGDRTKVLLADGRQPSVEVVGIFRFGAANNLMGARITAFDVDVAAQLLGAAGEVDSIDVVAADGVEPAVLADRIGATLPAGIEAVTGAQVANEAEEGVAGFLSTFQNVLLGFAAIAVFVSAFFINNTFSIVVGQRTRQLALLRSLGATGTQITGSVVGEALVVGVLAAGLGTAFGLAIAVVLQAILAAAGFGLPHSDLAVSTRTLVAAVVVGLGVTVAAAIVPARRASMVPPVEGMREGFVPTRWSRPLRIIVGAALSAAGLALVAAGLFVLDDTMAVVTALGAGAVGVFVGVAQLSPVVAVPLAGALGRPFVKVFGVVGRLADANAARNPDRTSKTASALMIGLALVTTVFVVGTSMKETFARSMEDAVSADYVLSTAGFIGFTPAVTAELATLPEVAAVSGIRFSRFKFNGSERDVVAVDADTAGALVDLDVRSGRLEDLDQSSILVHQDPASDLGLRVGDRVTVEFASGGPQVLTVAGIYGDATYAGNYLIDLDLFSRSYPATNLDLYAFVRVADDVDPAAARAAIEGVLADQPQIQLEDRAAFQDSQQAQFDSILIAVNGLLGLALFIALLGITNTLALSVLERTREIGLLRAVGMLRGQTRRMILVESAMVAMFGATLGIGVGLLFGAAAATALPDTAVTTTAIPWMTIGTIVVVAIACGLAAGALPARRAARLDILTAVHSD